MWIKVYLNIRNAFLELFIVIDIIIIGKSFAHQHTECMILRVSLSTYAKSSFGIFVFLNISRKVSVLRRSIDSVVLQP